MNLRLVCKHKTVRPQLEISRGHREASGAESYRVFSDSDARRPRLVAEEHFSPERHKAKLGLRSLTALTISPIKFLESTSRTKNPSNPFESTEAR
jgi:hypothetical protein